MLAAQARPPPNTATLLMPSLQGTPHTRVERLTVGGAVEVEDGHAQRLAVEGGRLDGAVAHGAHVQLELEEVGLAAHVGAVAGGHGVNGEAHAVAVGDGRGLDDGVDPACRMGGSTRSASGSGSDTLDHVRASAFMDALQEARQ